MARYRSVAVYGATGRVGREINWDLSLRKAGIEGKDAQLELIRQASDAGVKRFIASEYGVHPETDLGRSEFFARWTAIASGFFDNMLPILISANVQTSTLTLKGSGKTKYPFTVRHDIGRVLAETFKEPERYKDVWLTVVNAWYTFDEIVQRIEDLSGKKWAVEKVKTDASTPILHLVEQKGGDIVPYASGPKSSLVDVEDFDVILRRYVDELAQWQKEVRLRFVCA
ncbi:hypothetical protein PRZ48_013800 [Zasmidium cellare]|uniref:NmrA-like domain-containing protein n=1 Tax=Zasmidium cellare TaxID=395010 RepID=A0ABR0E224_ZASCE|nr:hypothetical protein PRZ48_013800 [Zasmidium cellare]